MTVPSKSVKKMILGLVAKYGSSTEPIMETRALSSQHTKRGDESNEIDREQEDDDQEKLRRKVSKRPLFFIYLAGRK